MDDFRGAVTASWLDISRRKPLWVDHRLLRDGDRISIDAVKHTLQIELSAAELRRRRAKWKAPKPYATKGVLAKYARNVSSASLGAVTD
jgi:dihydroxy-acid dehydratase